MTVKYYILLHCIKLQNLKNNRTMQNGSILLRVLFEISVTAKWQELEFYNMWEMDKGNQTTTVYNLSMGREKRDRER